MACFRPRANLERAAKQHPPAHITFQRHDKGTLSQHRTKCAVCETGPTLELGAFCAAPEQSSDFTRQTPPVLSHGIRVPKPRPVVGDTRPLIACARIQAVPQGLLIGGPWAPSIPARVADTRPWAVVCHFNQA
jgi:hypothetical protein